MNKPIHAIILAGLLIAATAPAAALAQEAATEHAAHAQASTEFDRHYARWAELSEDVWRFQVAGKDLCTGDRAWLPGFFTGATAGGVTAAGEDMGQVPYTILRVFDGGPAQAAGLMAGDVILAINGNEVQGNNWRGNSRWDAAWEEVKETEEASEYTVQRGGQRVTVEVQPTEVCDITLLYTASKLPITPKTQGVVFMTPLIDEVVQEPWQELAFLAPEIAVSMNTTRATQGKMQKAAGIFGNVMAAVTGVDLGGAAMVGIGLKKSKASRLEGDRVGLYLLARLGVDVAQVPGFWEQVYNFPRDSGWASTFFGTMPTLEERREVFDRTLAEIAAKRAAGAPLNPGDAEDAED